MGFTGGAGLAATDGGDSFLIGDRWLPPLAGIGGGGFLNFPGDCPPAGGCCCAVLAGNSGCCVLDVVCTDVESEGWNFLSEGGDGFGLGLTGGWTFG